MNVPPVLIPKVLSIHFSVIGNKEFQINACVCDMYPCVCRCVDMIHSEEHLLLHIQVDCLRFKT